MLKESKSLNFSQLKEFNTRKIPVDFNETQRILNYTYFSFTDH